MFLRCCSSFYSSAATLSSRCPWIVSRRCFSGSAAESPSAVPSSDSKWSVFSNFTWKPRRVMQVVGIMFCVGNVIAVGLLGDVEQLRMSSLFGPFTRRVHAAEVDDEDLHSLPLKLSEKQLQDIRKEIDPNQPITTFAHRSIPSLPPNSPLIVRQVITIVRHGHRTPIVYLTNKDDFQNVWGGGCHDLQGNTVPCGRGMLTPLGEAQMTWVGRRLRAQYADADEFIPRHLKDVQQAQEVAHQIFVRSTDIFRTQMTAMSLLNGLFPDLKSFQKFASNSSSSSGAAAWSAWPFILHTLPEKEETLYPSHRYCVPIRTLYANASKLHSSHLSGVSPQYAQVQQFFREKYYSTSSYYSWIHISDELKPRTTAGKPLPNGIDEEKAYIANLAAAKQFSWIVKGGQVSQNTSDVEKAEKISKEELKASKIGIGRFLHELLLLFSSTRAYYSSTAPESSKEFSIVDPLVDANHLPVKAAAPPKFLLFSGHDTTVLPFLIASGASKIFEDFWPPFASYIVLELLESPARVANTKSKWYLRMLVNGVPIHTDEISQMENRWAKYRVTQEEYIQLCRKFTPEESQVEFKW